jgi:aminoglycoside 3'-phosphotransferase-2
MPFGLPAHILQKLPEAWRADVTAVAAERITEGMSGAQVFRLRTSPSLFLKFADGSASQSLREEIIRTKWLADRGISVASVLRTYDHARSVAMLTRALPGEPANRSDRSRPDVLVTLGRAVAELHALPSAECPFNEILAVRLQRARHAIERGEVDGRHFASRNQNTAPADLLERLIADRPLEDFVVAHGDLTLSNMVIAPDSSVALSTAGILAERTAISIWEFYRPRSPTISGAARSGRSPGLMASSAGMRKRPLITLISTNSSDQ